LTSPNTLEDRWKRALESPQFGPHLVLRNPDEDCVVRRSKSAAWTQQGRNMNLAEGRNIGAAKMQHKRSKKHSADATSSMKNKYLCAA